LQRLCTAVSETSSDDEVLIGVLSVLLQLSRTVAVAHLSPDACKMSLFCYRFTVMYRVSLKIKPSGFVTL